MRLSAIVFNLQKLVLRQTDFNFFNMYYFRQPMIKMCILETSSLHRRILELLKLLFHCIELLKHKNNMSGPHSPQYSGSSSISNKKPSHFVLTVQLHCQLYLIGFAVCRPTPLLSLKSLRQNCQNCSANKSDSRFLTL